MAVQRLVALLYKFKYEARISKFETIPNEQNSNDLNKENI